MKNIVLIGMPAAGKSTISVALSKKLKMIRYDTDKMIENIVGMSVNNIFDKHGEKYFRKIESKVIKMLSFYNSIIISTGEGSIFSSINLKNLRRNSIIFFIDRNLDNIYNSNHSKRPFLKDDRSLVYTLYEKRLEGYQRAADYIIQNENEKLEEVVDKIIEIYLNNR